MENNKTNLSTIVYNADFMPIGYIYWTRAFDLLYFKKATLVESYEEKFRTPSFEAHIPKRIVLRQFVKFKQNPRYSKWNVFSRDEYKCGYCLEPLSTKEAELEHILPRSRGGKTTWENTVSACRKCNMTKGARTPEEAGMPLLIKPFKPAQSQWVDILLRRKFGDAYKWSGI